MLALKSKLVPICVALCALGTSVQAETFTIATGDDWSPFADSKMEGGGYANQIVSAVLTEMGTDFKIDIVPWTRAYEMTVTGNYDATFIWYDTAERRTEVNFTDPLIVVDTVVVMKAGAADGLNGLSDLDGQSVCIPKGYAVVPDVQAMIDGGKITLQQPPDLVACLKQVDAGRVDAVIDARSVLLDVASKNGIAEGSLAALPTPIAQAPMYLLVSKKMAGVDEFLTNFNAAFHKLEGDGAIDAILP
jgi:polar amino acid transport system substrate-binding protein